MREFETDQQLEDLIQAIPTVMALPLRRLLRATSGADCLEGFKDATDQISRFPALALISQFLADQEWEDDALLQFWQGMVQRNSDGAWGELVQRTLASAHQHGREPFLRELPDSRRRTERQGAVVWRQVVSDEFGQREVERRFGRFEFLFWARNEASHHRITADDEACVEALRHELIKAVRELAWLSRYELIVVDGNGQWLCRGEAPRRLEAVGGAIRVFLRHVEPASTIPSRVLELLPLVETVGRLGGPNSDGGRDLVLFNHLQESGSTQSAWYHGIVVDPGTGRLKKHLKNSTVPVDRLHHMLRGKRFPLVGFERLDAAGIIERIDMVTDGSFTNLQREQKFNRSLHVRRQSCEERVVEWIHAATPLLGVRGDPGCGKSAILASLVDGWRTTEGRRVLFVLAARHPEATTIDGLVCGALRIRGTSIEALSRHECLNGLVVVIDGINEHPNRDALLDGILVEARRTAQRGVGARFLLSWRRDGSEWLAHAFDQRSLWWSPHAGGDSSLDIRQSPESRSSARQQPAVADEDQSAVDHGASGTPDSSEALSQQPASDGAAPHATDAHDDDLPILDVNLLSVDEVRSIWRALSELWMSSGNDPLEIRRPKPARHPKLPDDDDVLARLSTPLELRMAFALHADQPIGSGDVESLHLRYVDLLRSPELGLRGAVARFLQTLGHEVLRARQNRVPAAAFESDLLSAAPLSALESLRRAGVVSLQWDGQHDEFVSFTVERIGEQVLGMLIAERTEATDPAWLASFATTLRELSLSEGAIRIALDHLTAGSGHLDYLVRFIDAVPADLARMAGSLLGRFMLDRGQYEARAVADQLFLQPSPSDTAVVHAAAAWLWDNEDSDAEVQFAFLDQCWPHVRPLAVRGDEHGLGVAREFARCLRQRRRALDEGGDGLDLVEPPESAVDWLQALIADMLPSVPPHARAVLQHELAEHLAMHDQGEEAVAAFRHARQLLEAAKAEHDVDSGRWLAAFVRVGESLAAIDRHEEALGEFDRALIEARTVQDAFWMDRALRGRARCLEELARWPEAIEMRQDLLTKAMKSNQRRSVAIAREMLGRCLRRAGHLVEARSAYEQSLRDGMHPRRVSEWSDAPACYWLSRIEEDLGNAEGALSWARRHVEAVRRDQGDTPGRDLAIALEQLGDAFAALDLHADAIGSFREALSIGLRGGTPVAHWNPNIPAKRLAASLVADGDIDGARSAWDDLIETLSGEPQRGRRATAIEHRGDLARELGEAVEAERCYRASLEVGMKPTQADEWSPRSALYELASLLSDLGRHDEALSLNDQYLRHADLEQDRRARAIALERRVDILTALGHTDEAIAAARSSLATGMGDGEWVEDWSILPATYRLTKLLKGRRDFEGAIAEWSKAIELLARRDDRRALAIAWEYLGDLRRSTDDVADAERCYRNSLEVGFKPRQAEQWSPRGALHELAALLSDLGRHDEALVLNDRYLHHADLEQERRARAIALERRSDILAALGRTEEAIAAARSSLAAGIGDGEWAKDWSVLPATRRLGKLLADRHDHTGAIAEWNQAIELLAGRDDRRALAVAWESKGDLLSSLDDPAQAEHCYRTSLEVGMQPTQAEEWSPRSALYELASLLSDLGRHDEALVLNDRYLHHADLEQERRARAIAFERRSDILLALGRTDEAILAARSSLATGIGDGDWVEDWSVLPATRCLTKLLAGRGDYAGAVAEWTKAIDLLAGRDDRRSLAIAWEYLGDLRRATDDAADAERCYRTSLEVGMQPTQAEEWSPRSALYELASLLSDLGRHDEALVLNDRYLHHADLEQERRSRAIAFERRSDILLALGRTDEAIAAARSSLATGIGDGDWVEDWSVLPATRRLTKLLAGRGDHTGAVAEWTKAIDLLAGRDDRRGLAIAWESKGNLLRSLDDPVQAERCYRTSLEVGMTPTQTARWTPRGPIWELARLYKDQGRVADALAMNDEYLVHAEREGDRRGLAFAWEQRGDIQRVADDPAEAERCYRTSLEVGMQPTQVEEWSPRSVLTELARCALMGESLDGLRACIDLLHDACLKECVIPWTPAALSVLLDMKTAPRADVDSLVDEVQSRFPPSHQPWCRPIVCALAAREIASLHPALARSLMKVAMRHYPAALDAARRATPSPAAPMALIMLTQCPTASFGPDGAIPTDRALKTIARALEAVQAMPDDHWLALQLPLKQASAIRQATGVLQSAPQP